MSNSALPFKRLTGHQRPIYAMVYLPEDDTIITAGEDRWIAKWNIEQNEAEALAQATATVYSLCWIPEKRWLAIGQADGHCILLDIDQKKVLYHWQLHSGGIFALTYLPSSACLLTSGVDGMVQSILLPEGEIQWRTTLPFGKIRELVLHPLHQQLLVPCFSGHLVWLNPIHGEITNTVLVSELPLHTAWWNPTGTKVITAGRDGHLHVLDGLSGEKIHALPAHHYAIYRLVSHPSEPWLMSASRDASVKIWHTKPLRPLGKMSRKADQGHRHSINAMACSSNGHTVFTAGDDKTIGIWHVSSYISTLHDLV